MLNQDIRFTVRWEELIYKLLSLSSMIQVFTRIYEKKKKTYDMSLIIKVHLLF